MANPILGSKNPKNAKALLDAGEITQSEYEQMTSQASKPKKAKKNSLMERWKELTD